MLQRSAFSIALIVVACSSAAADPFAEFRIPAHTTRQGIVYFEGVATWRDDQAPGSTQDWSSQRASLASEVSFGWDSDALLTTLAARATATGQRDRHDTRVESPFAVSAGAIRLRSALEAWGLAGSVRAYPWEVPLGIEASLAGNGSYDQRSEDREYGLRSAASPVRNEGDRHREVRSYAHRVEARAAVGLGRVRDASVVYDVHVLEERLRATGAIARDLSPETRRALAELFYMSPRYAAAHERPERWFWRDVERLLNEAGALGETHLDAFDLVRVLEATAPIVYAARPSPSGSLRQRGWFAGPVVVASHRRFVAHLEERAVDRQYAGDSLTVSTTVLVDRRDASSLDTARFGGRGAYHRQVGWDWQLDFETEVTAPVRPDEHGLDVRTAAAATWFVADRWRADLVFEQARATFEPRHSDVLVEDSWSAGFDVGIAFYVEDRTQLFARLGNFQERGHSEPATRYQRDTTLQLGMTYRFLGGLDAPGRIDPLRLMR